MSVQNDDVMVVNLKKHGPEKPLGFIITDNKTETKPDGSVTKVCGIFITRIMSGGLADSSTVLSVGDEVLMVNSVAVEGKTALEVQSLMIENIDNLIITVKKKKLKS